MLESAWLLLGLMGFVWTILVTITSSLVDEEGYDFIIVGASAGLVIWGVWTFAAISGVEVASDATVYNFRMAPVALVGIAMALPNLYLALLGPIEIIGRVNDTDMTDV